MSTRSKLALKIAAGAGAAILAGLFIISVEITRHPRSLVTAWLSRQFNGSVQLSDFHAAIDYPRLECEADGVTLRFEGREDLPPMIAMRRLTVSASIWGLLRLPARIHSVVIEGLEVNVPPRTGSGGGQRTRNFMRGSRQARFDEIRSDGAVLKILPRLPGKTPHEFDISELHLSSTGSDGALAFGAKLSNPAPPGEVTSSGIFGPWNIEKPSLTPIRGAYVFENANLGVFNGIAGMLSSEGKYQGVLEDIEVDGTTDTSDFQVSRAGHSIHLTTTFNATVDGTDGNTYLHPVVSRFGKTTLVAHGKIEGIQGKPGRTVALDVSIDAGRIEDLLLLTVEGNPPMTGPVRLKTSFILSPGPKNILDRLALDSSFELPSAHFTNPAAQQRVDNMSARSEGKPKEVKNPAEATSDDDVAAGVNGKFRLKEGILTLTAVQFQIPGADMRITGTYAMEKEDLDLSGTLKIQAPLSHTQTGIKSALLRLADPFFSKNGHTELPVKITGPMRHPHYGLDLRHKEQNTANAVK